MGEWGQVTTPMPWLRGWGHVQSLVTKTLEIGFASRTDLQRHVCIGKLRKLLTRSQGNHSQIPEIPYELVCMLNRLVDIAVHSKWAISQTTHKVAEDMGNVQKGNVEHWRKENDHELHS